MIMITIAREFFFLTAAFPHGAYQSQGANQPDLRAPSIKGQLRWWYDAIYGDKGSEDILFGGLKNPKIGDKPGPESSRVSVRIEELAKPAISPCTFIPHKGQKGGSKQAI
jgi:CRISPR type III-B/RAMP module RAMP protein Cmr1